MSLLPFNFNKEGILCKVIKKTDSFRFENYAELKTDDAKKGIFRLQEYKQEQVQEKKEDNEEKVNDKIKLIKWDDEIDTLNLEFFQFKIGRCGSNLLCNMLAVDKIWKIVFEPNLHFIFKRIQVFDEEITLQKVFKKTIDILCKKENENQTACFIDLSPLVMEYYKHFEKCFPSIKKYVLWRHPLKVARSYIRKQAGFWRNNVILPPKDCKQRNLGIMRSELYNVSKFDFILKFIKDVPSKITLFYYEHVLNINLIYWIYDSIDIYLDDKKVLDMKKVFKYDSKNKRKTFDKDVNETDIYPKLKAKFSYNKEILDFHQKYPPHIYIFKNSKGNMNKDDNIKKPNVFKTTTPMGDYFDKLSNYYNVKKFKAIMSDDENYYSFYDNNLKNNFKKKFHVVTLRDWDRSKNLYSFKNLTNDFFDDISFQFDNVKTILSTFTLEHRGTILSHGTFNYDRLITIIYGEKDIILLSKNIVDKYNAIIKNESIKSKEKINFDIRFLNRYYFKLDWNEIYSITLKNNETLFIPKGWFVYEFTKKERTMCFINLLESK
jgi:hypothetical protein